MVQEKRKRKSNQLRQISRMTYGGALALQGVDVLRGPRTAANLAGIAGGTIGIGIAGGMSELAFEIMDSYPFNKKIRKKRR